MGLAREITSTPPTEGGIEGDSDFFVRLRFSLSFGWPESLSLPESLSFQPLGGHILELLYLRKSFKKKRFLYK